MLTAVFNLYSVHQAQISVSRTIKSFVKVRLSVLLLISSYLSVSLCRLLIKLPTGEAHDPWGHQRLLQSSSLRRSGRCGCPLVCEPTRSVYLSACLFARSSGETILEREQGKLREEQESSKCSNRKITQLCACVSLWSGPEREGKRIASHTTMPRFDREGMCVRTV